MTRLASRLALGALFLLAAAPAAWSHCEVPCGIYGDKARVDALYEHATTIEKAMRQVEELAGKDDPQSANQLARWVANKEEHATAFQHIVSQYFMTQRIKPTTGEGRARYLTQITKLHALLRQAMKCKQTVDPAEVATLRGLIDDFCAAYFSDEDLAHIREHHGPDGD